MTAVSGKLFHVLTCVADDDHDVVSLARLMQLTGLPKATVYRLLVDMVEAGILEHGPGGYSLGSRLFEFGTAAPRYRRLREAALPYLEELREQLPDTIHLATVVGNKVLVLEKLHGRHHFRIPTAPGSKLPLHSTALGKVVLANSEELTESVFKGGLGPVTRRTVTAPGLLFRQIMRAREEGVAFEAEETVLAVGCAAAPLYNEDGTIIGAISLVGDPTTKRTNSTVTRLRRTAHQITKCYNQELLAC
ncbi:IclR family transcriptional regulator [Rhodococcus opacus]|nr:IclR family transcriptional regulator [Rhodococcus opacus]